MATLDGLNLSKDSLRMWNSHLGERYTTKKWAPGMKTKRMMKIQKGESGRKAESSDED